MGVDAVRADAVGKHFLAEIRAARRIVQQIE